MTNLADNDLIYEHQNNKLPTYYWDITKVTFFYQFGQKSPNNGFHGWNLWWGSTSLVRGGCLIPGGNWIIFTYFCFCGNEIEPYLMLLETITELHIKETILKQKQNPFFVIHCWRQEDFNVILGDERIWKGWLLEYHVSHWRWWIRPICSMR